MKISIFIDTKDDPKDTTQGLQYLMQTDTTQGLQYLVQTI